MSRKTRNIIITILLCVIGILLIGYGLSVQLNKGVDVVVQVEPEFTDTDVDYFGNTWRLEVYNSEEGKYIMLEVYMEENHDMKWYGSVTSGPAEINYIIYQNDHYVMSINPNWDGGSSELGFLFDKLEPDHSKTASYMYYRLNINEAGDGTWYNVIGGELIDEVSEIEHDESHEIDTTDMLELNR